MRPVAALKRWWSVFKAEEPGHRFEAEYRRQRASNRSRPWVARLPLLGGAVLCLAVGVLLCFIPGPGVPFLAVGAGLLSSQSLALSRFMDRGELAARALYQRARATWHRMPPVAKASAALAVLAVTAGFALAVTAAWKEWR